MADQVTRVTRTSWGSRLGKAVGGTLTGIVLVLGSVGALAWNEHRAVTTERALSEGAGAVIPLDENGYAPLSYGEDFLTTGMLVHATGALEVPNRMFLYDSFNLPGGVPQDATRLERVVEMYQWQESSKSETRNKIGGGTETVTTYSYAKDWSEAERNSGSFAEPTGHQNPPMPFASETVSERRRLVVGENEWIVPAEKVATIGEVSPVQLDQIDADAMTSVLNSPTPVTLSANTLYVGYNPTRPQVGDLRISYRVARADTASVVAMDTGYAELEPWVSSNGHEIFLIDAGAVSAAVMFSEAQDANRMLTWIWRGGGVFAMLVGFGMVLGLLGVIADVIPPLGALVRAGTGLVAFGLTIVLAPLVIGLAWLAVRPLLAGGLILAGIAIGGGILWLARRKPARQPETPAVAV